MFKGSASSIPHTEDTLETVKKNLAKKKAILIDVRERGKGVRRPQPKKVRLAEPYLETP